MNNRLFHTRTLIQKAVFIVFFIQTVTSMGQTGKTTDNMNNRKASHAGKFYTSDAGALLQEINNYITRAETEADSSVAAIISPHAGFVYSGDVAGFAFASIPANAVYENVFIIATSHITLFGGASVYCEGNYETPLGEVKVNTELAKKLIAENPGFLKNLPEVHTEEHSIEMQLPFLQCRLGQNVKIIPIITGFNKASDAKQLADILRPYFNHKNLFIISSDFSHYPGYSDAVKTDNLTAAAICTGNPEKVTEILLSNKQKNIPGLSTSMCGWTGVLTLMYLTSESESFNYVLLKYENSGDKSPGDKNRVVGYNAIKVARSGNKGKETGFVLTDYDKTKLLAIARTTIDSYVRTSELHDPDTTGLSENAKTNCGVFVTLHLDGKLRGCIGTFGTETPLYLNVRNMAISSAVEDSRFMPVKENELDSIVVEISVLSPMKRIQSPEDIVLGRHGIYIKKDFNSGTFLPQVATETGWTLEEFLGHCSEDKAGIGWDGWKTAEVYIYEAIVFSEEQE